MAQQPREATGLGVALLLLKGADELAAATGSTRECVWPILMRIVDGHSRVLLSTLLSSIDKLPNWRRDNSFINMGDSWFVSFGGTPCVLADHVGVRYLAHLLRHPGKMIRVEALMRAAGVKVNPPSGEAARSVIEQAGTELSVIGMEEPLLAADARTISEIRSRQRALKEELREAEATGKTKRVAKLQAESEQIAAYLGSVADFRSRPRKLKEKGSSKRTSVKNAIDRVNVRLREVLPALAEHLNPLVLRTGMECSYRPSGVVKWKFEIGSKVLRGM